MCVQVVLDVTNPMKRDYIKLGAARVESADFVCELDEQVNSSACDVGRKDATGQAHCSKTPFAGSPAEGNRQTTHQHQLYQQICREPESVLAVLLSNQCSGCLQWVYHATYPCATLCQTLA